MVSDFYAMTPAIKQQLWRRVLPLLVLLAAFVVLYNDSLYNIISVESTLDADSNVEKVEKNNDQSCNFRLFAFNRNGKSSTAFTNECITSEDQLLNHLNSLAQNENNNETEAEDMVASFAIGSAKTDRNNNLGRITDEFLSPHFEWRLMAERFQEFGSSNEDDISAVNRGRELFYDPAIFTTDQASFGLPAALARRSLLQRYTDKPKMERSIEEETLFRNGIDFIFVRLLDQQVAAFAAALRRHQFPQDCADQEKRDAGRTFATYAAGKDFLGAMTRANVGVMRNAIHAGAPFVNLAPPIWSRTYQFEGCTKANGMECAFLPVFGGKCLTSRVQSSIECLSGFKMGYNQNIAFPKDGIPDEVCQEGRDQFPALAFNATFQLESYDFGTGPPDAFTKYCPSCNSFSGKEKKPTAAVILDEKVPLGLRDMELLDAPIIDYISEKNSSGKTCTMEVPPLTCDLDRYCCVGELSIPQNVLDEKRSRRLASPQTSLLDNSLSAYLTRFNRESRERIARLHQPRAKAMDAREQGWEGALSSGNCATLHIRRGDNINRCNAGEKHFCSMNLTLADYMSHALPMLSQLDAKNVFVMTDDPDIVAPDMLRPWQEQGYFLEVVSGHNQYSTETYSDWDPFLGEKTAIPFYLRLIFGSFIAYLNAFLFFIWQRAFMLHSTAKQFLVTTYQQCQI